jgi:hypothetical protein
VTSSYGFADNAIGVGGARAIATALEQNNVLSALELYGNNIGIEGGRVLVRALEKNATLTSAEVGGALLAGSSLEMLNC